MELKCQTPKIKPMVGYAVTCLSDTTSPGESRPMRLDELLDAIDAAPRPAVLVVKHVGHDRSRSCFFGDMWCLALHKLGVAGIVTDGGGRDLDGIKTRAPGFHVFSTGWVVSHGRGTYFNVGTTVSICGLTIRSGDLLHGDDNGLLTVPPAISERLVTQAEGVRKAEAEYFEFAESDAFSVEALKLRIGIPRDPPRADR